jgi:2-methylcitrate dehydratase PrpD
MVVARPEPPIMAVTAAAAAFVERITFADVPQDALRIARRYLLDGLGLIVAGSEEETVRILATDVAAEGHA